MRFQRLAWFSAAASIVVTGCGHHRVGRPPNAADIAEINGAADPELQPAMTLIYCAGVPCSPWSAPASAVWSIPSGSPTKIERIVGSAGGRLTVVEPTGEARTVDLALVRGAAVRSRKRTAERRGVAGGAIGLGLSGLLMLSFELLKGAPDQSLAGEQAERQPSPVAAELGIVAGTAAIGALLGALTGYWLPGEETFDFGEVGR